MSYRPRIIMEVTQEQMDRVSNLLPWGIRGKILMAVIDQVLDLVEHYGLAIVGAILAGDLSFIDVIRRNDENRRHKAQCAGDEQGRSS